MRSTDPLTTTETALRLGITASQVRRLAAAGQFKGARRIGRDWLIPSRSLEAARPTVGRPRKITL